MRLKVGDKIYLNPDYIYNQDQEEKMRQVDILGVKISMDELFNKPFEVTSVRNKTEFNGDDIAINWFDHHQWWWGQIGETEPWTIKFISEKEYLRNKKLKDLGI